MAEQFLLSCFISFNSQFLFYLGPSFTTIAAFGANSAVIHYTPTKETDAKINTTNLFLGKFDFFPCQNGILLSKLF